MGTAPVGAGSILVVDNRDSYTYNLVQLLRQHSHREVRVVSADDGDEAIRCFAAGEVAGVVISPGPGHPDRAADFEASGALIDAVIEAARDAPATPMLGVCLGHQGLARRFGYRVVAAPEPRHGWLSPLTHTGEGLFRGLQQGTRVTRYHSLAIVPGDAPDERLRVTARSEDGVIQAFEIDGAPWFGVQFHPESIASDDGPAVIERFLERVEAAAAGQHRDPARLHLAVREIDLASTGLATRQAAIRIAQRVIARGRGSFWLDSALVDGEARFSVLGDASDALGDGTACVLRFRGGVVTRDTWPGGAARVSTTQPCDDPFAFLADEQHRMHVLGGQHLPFRGGHVGYFGYELGLRQLGLREIAAGRGGAPDACWIRPSRFFTVDHETGRASVAVVGAHPDTTEATVDRERAALLEALRTADGGADAAHPDPDRLHPDQLGRWRDDRAAYAAKIAACQRALRAGDSYELCLTTAFEVDESIELDALDLFVDLAEHHPAPYAALIEFDDERDDIHDRDIHDRHDRDGRDGRDGREGGNRVAIVSASPERFLRGEAGRYETKPIKGTAPRAADPEHDSEIARRLASDPKTFAENLMIVDLLRNDLGRVCEPGSVEVTDMMRVESYATLHQLVSTVRGTAMPGIPPAEVARALFPGGSMTGAPKLRSVELLAELEGHPRGVYSGALGYFGFDGRTDLSIVIRTAVLADGRWSIGAGGAIVLASDAEAETDEVELKTLALRRAIGRVGRARRVRER